MVSSRKKPNSGAMGSFWLADCHSEKCQEDDDIVGFVPGNGFANCVAYVGVLDFDKRVAYYDKKLSQDPKLQMVKDAVKKENMESIPLHQMWDVALRMDFPEHFGMPGDMLGSNKDQYFKSAVHYVFLGNPAAKMAIGVVSAALDIVELAFDFAIDTVKKLGNAVRYPFLTKSKRLTTHKVLKYYHDECMGITCHSQMHPTMSLEMPFFSKKLKWKKQNQTCGSRLYQEPGLDEASFQEARLNYMLKHMRANEQTRNDRKGEGKMRTKGTMPENSSLLAIPPKLG